MTSAGAGLGIFQTCALSLLVFTGASQFALAGALAAGGNPLTAAAVALVLRAPFLLVVGLAVIITAGVRALGG